MSVTTLTKSVPDEERVKMEREKQFHLKKVDKRVRSPTQQATITGKQTRRSIIYILLMQLYTY